jgi:hypothetical protein
VLLESNVFVLGNSAGGQPGARTIAAGETISILNWARSDGSPIIPFFTSLAALQRAIDEECSYLGLEAKALFELAKGAHFVLNPTSDYGREFLPDEIDALLSGGVARTGEQRIVQKDTKVLLGQPAQYPAQMVEALAKFFAKRSEVKAAYMALMHDPARDAKPHLIIGIQAEGDIERLIREAGSVAGDTSPAGEPVDLCQVVPGEKTLSEYFLNSVKPFYERGWGARLKSIFRG